MKNNKLVAPVLKWAGGKRQILEALISLLPDEKITVYCEPFVGGGALLFRLRPQTAFINDINGELMGVYGAIKDDVEALIAALETFRNDPDCFYAVRSWDRNKTAYKARTAVEKAARILYLNKTCYNGLFRVNSAGEFNSPFGNYRNPNIVNASTLRAVCAYFNAAEVRLTSVDYTAALRNLPKEAFVYLDPPYDPVSDTANFTSYARGGFSRKDQIALRAACDELNARGIKFMLSNSATDFIKELYSPYNVTIIRAKRAINSNSAKRGEVDELIARNYK
ncbi:MAG: DNA adenine methylase [Helicobacteraceae bacterium]|nr:DNA adenine methylase [Helicobacteraceae bacterium]